MRSTITACLLATFLIAGCGSEKSESNAEVPPGETCAPSEADWAQVQPVIETACGLCHGETPQFGAPYSLLKYQDLVAGEPGSRVIDTLIREVRSGDMPPVGQRWS